MVLIHLSTIHKDWEQTHEGISDAWNKKRLLLDFEMETHKLNLYMKERNEIEEEQCRNRIKQIEIELKKTK